MPDPLRILGVDTSLRSTGVAVLQSDGVRHRALSYGRIAAPASWSRGRCLVNLQARLAELLRDQVPTVAAIEGIFYSRSVKTAFILGEARGVVIATCAAAGLSVFEYAPRSVKQGVVGSGAADKSQVAQMMKTLLALPDLPQNDAADALALAYCHASHLRSSVFSGRTEL